jgi:hypothetical protein
MNAEELTKKYINAMEKTLQNAQRSKRAIVVTEACVDEIYSYVTSYLKDARYFSEHKQFETSLTSIAYCEGLLDALKLIGAVEIASTP